MRKILSKSDLFSSVDHIVDVCAIAMIAMKSPIVVNGIKEAFGYTDEDINQFREELERFFGDEER